MFRFLLGASALLPLYTVASTLTLSQAVDRVVAEHPAFSASVAARDAAVATVRADAAWPHPELTVSAEDWAADARGGQGSVKIAISQSFPAAGRQQVAEAASRTEHARVELKRWEMQTAVRRAYRLAQAERARLDVRRDYLVLARRIREAAELRRAAGTVPETVRLRAIADEQREAVLLYAATQGASAADRELALAMGLDSIPWSELEALPDTVALPDPAVVGSLDQHPELILAKDDEARVRVARNQAARASGWAPEIGFAAGQDREQDTAIVDAWIGFALPLGTRVREARRAASAQLASAEYQRTAVENALRLERWKVTQAIPFARDALQSGRAAVGAALAAQELAQTAYEAGKGTLQEWIDARRAAAEARLQLIGELESALLLQVEVEGWSHR